MTPGGKLLREANAHEIRAELQKRDGDGHRLLGKHGDASAIDAEGEDEEGEWRTETYKGQAVDRDDQAVSLGVHTPPVSFKVLASMSYLSRVLTTLASSSVPAMKAAEALWVICQP